MLPAIAAPWRAVIPPITAGLALRVASMSIRYRISSKSGGHRLVAA